MHPMAMGSLWYPFLRLVGLRYRTDRPVPIDVELPNLPQPSRLVDATGKPLRWPEEWTRRPPLPEYTQGVPMEEQGQQEVLPQDFPDPAAFGVPPELPTWQ